MATRAKARNGMTLDEFLAWPRIDERPYLEYYDGHPEVKVSPGFRHNVLSHDLTTSLNGFARPPRLGRALIEQRCTFGGKSIIPDVVFLLKKNIRRDASGEFPDHVLIAPDIHVEVRSPRQSKAKTVKKIEHSLAHGCLLAWYFDPIARAIDVFRPGQAPGRPAPDGFLVGDPVLPGYRVAVAEIFAWLLDD